VAAAERVLTALAVIAIVAIVAIYLAIIRSQGGQASDTPLIVPFVASYLALMAALLAASFFTPAAWRPALRAAASAGLVFMGVLAAFSIGLAILVAAALAIASAVLSARARPGGTTTASSGVAVLLAVALLVAGFEFSWSYLVCPASGESGGSTASFLGRGSSYDCHNGVLTVH
jgi:hypothetical protein